jgi:hypothetical protein
VNKIVRLRGSEVREISVGARSSLSPSLRPGIPRPLHAQDSGELAPLALRSPRRETQCQDQPICGLTPSTALGYLRARDTIPHRIDALEVVLRVVCRRGSSAVLDLGTGAGDLLAPVLAARPGASGIGLDFGDEIAAAGSSSIRRKR